MNQFNAQYGDQSPLIIIGMHRSGTSVITDALRTMGWHGGADILGGHSESNFFLKENQRIFGLAHAEWDLPLPMEWLLNDTDVFDKLASDLKDRLNSPESDVYWGKTDCLENLSAYGWGWKDPRNTITLPIWLKLFPKAKVLNIVRNGTDVASSLFERENARKLRFDSKARSSRCQDLERCFSLWSEYVTLADTWPDKFTSTRFKTIYYEDFLIEPGSVIADLLKFICSDNSENNPEMDINKIKEIGDSVISKNVNKNKGNPDIVELYKRTRHHPLMQKHQYCVPENNYRYA